MLNMKPLGKGKHVAARCATALMALVIIMLAGCDRTESDWKQAKDANTAVAYAQFVAAHPKGPHTDEAQAAIENLDWTVAKDANTVPAYEGFLSNHPTGRHSEGAKTTLQDLRWAEAKLKTTIESYKSFVAEFPGSPYSSEANARIAALGLTKADSISITDGGMGANVYGGFSAKLSPSGSVGNPEIVGPKRVFIFRNLTMGAEQGRKLGIKVGAAYLWQDNQYLYIRDVDLRLSDKALCAQFGVRTGG